MQLHNLKRKNKNKTSIKIGRGGKRGKTSGRGHKGQNARAGRKKRPEMRDLIKKFPKLRGRGKSSLKSRKESPVVVKLKMVDSVFSSGDSVNPKTLLEKKVISLKSGKLPRVTISGTGDTKKILNFSLCHVTASAKVKIESLKGKIKEEK